MIEITKKLKNISLKQENYEKNKKMRLLKKSLKNYKKEK